MSDPQGNDSISIKDGLSVPDCLKALSDKDYRVRSNAVEALIGVADPQIILPILTLVKNTNEDKWCRMRALDVLAQFDKPELVDEYYSLLRDENVSQSAAFNLSKQSDPKAYRLLLIALCSENLVVKYSAAYGIGHCADVKALLPLCQMLEDSDDDIRRIAVDSISKFWPNSLEKDRQSVISVPEEIHRSVVTALIKATRDENEYVRYRALWNISDIDKSQALPFISSALLKYIQAALGSNYQDRRESLDFDPIVFLHLAITTLGNKLFCEPLSLLLNSKSWQVKIDAIITLFNLGDDRGLDFLILALEQEDWIVKVTAATMLLERGDKCGWDILVKGLTVEDVDDDMWWYIQASIVTSLADSGDPRTVDVFIDTLDCMRTQINSLDIDGMMISDEVLCTIIDRLGAIGDARAIEAIKKWQGYDIVGVSWSETREDTVEKALESLTRT